jgi:L-alanine-DL-glutamate epimerase-like enolase superfamily enzyme
MRTFRIVDVRATTVAVPLKATLRHSNGCDWGRFVRTVVEVGTDQGLIGLGERFLTKGPGLWFRCVEVQGSSSAASPSVPDRRRPPSDRLGFPVDARASRADFHLEANRLQA